jgi:hypothetical protein
MTIRHPWPERPPSLTKQAPSAVAGYGASDTFPSHPRRA